VSSEGAGGGGSDRSGSGAAEEREGTPAGSATGPRDGGLRERVNAGRRWPSRCAVWRERWDYFWIGERPEPIPAYRGPVEEPPQELVEGRPGEDVVGICCSGGGIRSAAFNLGALQALGEKDKLKSARYLAAVSGGSYIAAAFAMVAKTTRRNGSGGGSGDDDSDFSLIEDEQPFAEGSPEEQYLRNRGSYLAPDGMAKLFLAYRVVLGLVFNVVFISLPLFGAAMLLGVFAYRHAFPTLVGVCGEHCHKVAGACGTTPKCAKGFELPDWSWIAPTAIAGLSAGMGGVALVRRFTSARSLRGLQVWSTRLLLFAAGVALITLALPEAAALVHVRGAHGKTTATGAHPAVPIAGAAGGLAGLLAGIVAHVRGLISDVDGVESRFKSLSKKARMAVAYAAALLVGPALLFGMMVFSLSLTLVNSEGESGRWWLRGGGVGAIVLFGALYFLTDLTSLSLHPFYKRRLCVAFALKRVRPPSGGRAATTAQEEEQGIAVERDYDNLVKLSETGLEREGWPTLLVCAAANVSDPGATPPGRHVTSFTFSAHTIGGPLIGATSTDEFEKALEGNERRSRDLTLLAAVAMSGAAIAPSMGKKTRWPLTFLMALANVRLGVWVPNPRWVAASAAAGSTPWKHRAPSRPRPSYLLRELTGRNRVDAKYLYVTDGGHYENLGLVELLRRGCTRIYCFDASGGATFEELGDAVALARSELGVEIDIDPKELEPKVAKDAGGEGCAEGTGGEAGGENAGGETGAEGEVAEKDVIKATFTYRGGPSGVLVYARNVMTADAPWDVKAHHRADPSFPHDSTMDQLYTDQKFESYRALGKLAGEHAAELMASA
jgi:Patatin-like phospholipase